MRFYLGTHMPNWLAAEDVPVPLFVSRVRLVNRKTLPRATHPWALDSGGFTALHRDGTWRLSVRAYADEVGRYAAEIGMLDWAAPMDWMCEPTVREKTGLTVAEHQRRTTINYLELADQLGRLVIPVLQGWESDDYLRHVELYDRFGVDLTHERTVGLGSVCRRGQDAEIVSIVQRLTGLGLSLHGFGVRGLALPAAADYLASADSMAWSYQARRNPPHPSCTHARCANCRVFALAWRDRQMARMARPRQLVIGEHL